MIPHCTWCKVPGIEKQIRAITVGSNYEHQLSSCKKCFIIEKEKECRLISHGEAYIDNGTCYEHKSFVWVAKNSDGKIIL